MFAPLPPETRDELEALGRRYGQPLVRSVAIGGSLFDPLDRADRYGEVCMVLRRRNGALVTAIKSTYPPGAYRLLTGGIGHGERIEDALRREVAEETSLAVAVRRFLAAVQYRQRGEAVFYTFAFLLEELSGELRVADDEDIADFCEIEVADLPATARFLRALDGADPAIRGDWGDWGRFRAVIHEVVWEALGDA